MDITRLVNEVIEVNVHLGSVKGSQRLEVTVNDDTRLWFKALQRYKAVQYLFSNFVHLLAKYDFTSALLYKVRHSRNYTSDDHSQNWLMLCLKELDWEFIVALIRRTC